MKRKIRNLKRRWRKLAWYNQMPILILIAAAILQMLILNIIEAILLLWVLYLYCDLISEYRKVAYTIITQRRFGTRSIVKKQAYRAARATTQTSRRGRGKDTQLFRVRNQV